MPRVATGGELALLRSDGQASKLYAAFFVPHVIYTAQLSSVPSSTDQVVQISFGSGVGTLANVLPDMLLKVGSTAGNDDLGIARIRKAPIAGTFYIGEQSVIRWAAVSPVYLTVVDDYDLWSKHVRIDGTTIYMDYDIAFSNQHTVFSPVPVLGPIVSVVKLVEGIADIQIGPEDGYHSWVIGSTITGHNWTSPSGDISFDDNTLESPVATVTAPGWHLVYDEVTAANIKKRKGIRYIYAWDDDNPPLTVAQLGDNVEDNKIGGSNFELVFSDQASLTEIPDRALCVLFSEDYYGIEDSQQKVSLGAVLGRENIIYTGRVISESLSYDDETQTASINVQGYQELFKMINAFPAGLRFKITPAVWTDMPSMTVDRALFHLLEYHTTALTIMDFNPTNDTRYTAQAFSPFASIWEQMKEFAERQIYANTHIDHLGRLFFEIDPQLLPVADRGYPVIMTLLDKDLTGRVELPREILAEIGQVNMSGVAIDGGGNAVAFFSLFPGHIHERTGRIDLADKLLLADQTQANILSGLKYAKENNPYKPMRVKLSANNRLATCFPNQAVSYTISADKNPRGFAITKNWIPRQRKLSYDAAVGSLSVEFVLEAETIPGIGIKGDVPGSSDFSFPPLASLPSLPTVPIILPGGSGPVSEGGPASVLIRDTGDGLFLCQNFNAGENEQEWFSANGGLSADEIATIKRVIRCPNGAVYVVGGNRSTSKAYYVKRAARAGAIFETIEDQASINTKLGTSGFDGGVSVIVCNPLLPEFIAYTLMNIPANANLKVYRGNYPTFSLGVTITTGDPRIGDLSYGNGKWIYTGNGLAAKWFRLDPTLTTQESSGSLAGSTQHRHIRISTTGDVYHYTGPSQTISKSSNNCASFVDSIGSNYATGSFSLDPVSIFAIDPTGQYICTDRATTGKGKSSDFGATLSDIANLPSTGHNWRFAQAGGVTAPLSWIAASGGGYIYYTGDFFNTAPMDKRGNILSLVGVLNCVDVIIIEA